MWLSTSCCTSDNCTSPIVTAPPFSSQPNGLICPSCQALDSDWCSNGNTLPCYGDEIYCVQCTTTIDGSQSIVRGCGSKGTCGGRTYRVDGSLIQYNRTCIGGGYSLTCPECRATNSTSCMGQSVTCKKNDLCATSYSVTLNSDGTSSLELIRSCAPSSQCNYTGKISFPTGKMWMSISCCASDNCTSPNVTTPSFSSQLNGLICPSCQSSDSDWCYSGNTVPCYGDEKVCVLHTTTRDGRKSSFRGCAPQSTCGSHLTYIVNGSSITYDLSCTCGGTLTPTKCADTDVTCAAGTVCATVRTLTTMGDASSERFTKTCSPINQCGISGTASIPKGKMKIMTACTPASCPLPFPEFPNEKSDTNGVTCRKCLSANSDCYTSETMQCAGDERACLLQSTDLTGRTTASVAMRGCTTKNICDLSRQDYTVDGITSTTKFTCTSGTDPVQRGLLYLTVISLVIGKYLTVDG
ncbi:uncharacterized protein [Dendropsophus ebraccatus]